MRKILVFLTAALPLAAWGVPPVVVGDPPPLSLAEDSGTHTVSFAGVFNAPADTATLAVESFDAVTLTSASMSGEELSVTLALDQSGDATVVVRATNSVGEFTDYAYTVSVTPVNDAPFVAGVAAPDPLSVTEDAAPASVSFAGVFDDPDLAAEGDALTLTVAGTSGAVIESAVMTDDTLDVTFVANANGAGSITVRATDAGVPPLYDEYVLPVDVASVDDAPVAVDDVVSMLEDGDVISIPVMDNDDQGDGPALITVAGVGGASESPPTTFITQLGDEITAPNGAVAINGNTIDYQPKEHFYGQDFFYYVITDSNGDNSEPARVTVNVAPVNDAPSGFGGTRSHTILENGVLVVSAADGALKDAYDVDQNLFDENGDPIGGGNVTAFLTSVPAVGTLAFDGATGAYTYQPPVDTTGGVNFSFLLTDGISSSTGMEFVVEIDVVSAPGPTPPPTPGEVAVDFNLANTPLEQSAGVPANVLLLFDDSGSMDWNLLVPGEDEQGGMVISSANRQACVGLECGTGSVLFPELFGSASTTYRYLYDLPTHTFQDPFDWLGFQLPTQEAVDAEPQMAGNDYGVWRGFNYKHNKVYYNPSIEYRPWKGVDTLGVAFADAPPWAARLEPRNPSQTINLLEDHNYLAVDVPLWTDEGTKNLNVTTYIPHYWSTPGDEPIAHDAARTKVVIKPGFGPLNGGSGWPGSAMREDCAARLVCTYDEEIRNFANWFSYYRSRNHSAKAAVGNTLADVQDLRVGWEGINGTNSRDVEFMNDLFTEGAKRELLDTAYDSVASGSTPLREALDRGGKILGCDAGGDCPALDEPDRTCQQNFALLFTDGYWNGGAVVTTNEDLNTVNNFDGGRYEDNFAATLADAAMLYYKNDLFPASDDRVPLQARDKEGAAASVFEGEDVMHQHIKTYGIAFGVPGTIDPEDVPDDATEAFDDWPNPTTDPRHKIDDLLHASVNGRGEFLNASDPQELQNAVANSFVAFRTAVSSTSSATFSSTSLRQGTLLYRGFYDLGEKTGELTATEVESDGSLAEVPEWRASARLNPPNATPASRKIVTFDPGSSVGVPFRHGGSPGLNADQMLLLDADQVDHLRGARGEEYPAGALRARPTPDGLLGDIVNSSPVFIGAPQAINRDQAPYPTNDLYSSFAAANADRRPIVYVGANDGMMHGFDAISGDEVFGYIPNKVISFTASFRNRLDVFTDRFYQHEYFVDLTPRFNDVYMQGRQASKAWRTLMVGGLGAGGKGFFGLDVTDATSQFATEGSTAQSVLWEFTDEDDTYPVNASGVPLGGSVGAIVDPNGNPVNDLGYALSLPTIAMSNVDSTSTPVEKEWVAIFGNGPNSTAGIAKLFVLFVDKGANGWAEGDFVKVSTDTGVPTSGPLTGFPNGLGTATALDRDLDGTVDWVYAGDRLGNLWRFNIEDPSPANWRASRIFTATYDDGSTTRVQPILSKPLVTKHPTQPGFLIVFGTGSFITKDDATNQEVQSIYGIWDRGEDNHALTLPNSKALRLVEQTITNVVDDSVTPAVTRRQITNNSVSYAPEGSDPGTFGWFIDLDMERAATTISGDPNLDPSGAAPPAPQFAGEKAIRRLLLRDGTVITTTVLPAVGAASCFGARPGSILLFDLATGGDPGDPLVDFNTDGYVDEGDLITVGGDEYAAGVLFNQQDLDGSLVDLSTLGGEGNTDWLFVSGGTETIAYRIDDLSDNRQGRLSWRQVEEQ